MLAFILKRYCMYLLPKLNLEYRFRETDGLEISNYIVLSATYENGLKDVVISVTLPKWTHKHFQENSGENHYENLKLFKILRLDKYSDQEQSFWDYCYYYSQDCS